MFFSEWTREDWNTFLGILGSVTGLLSFGYLLIDKYRPYVSIQFGKIEKCRTIMVGEQLICNAVITAHRSNISVMLPSLEGKFHAGLKMNLETVHVVDTLANTALAEGPIQVARGETRIIRLIHRAVKEGTIDNAWYQVVLRPGGVEKKSRQFKIIIERPSRETARDALSVPAPLNEVA